jgi:mannose-1-phosphate guanylyltransferase
MAGGSGERFWPLSRPDRPKQLLKLTSPHETMLAQATRRAKECVGEGGAYVATTLRLIDPVRDAALVPNEQVLAEPARRNTLGCLCWLAATLIARGQENAVVGILTADHAIGDDEVFLKTLNDALDLAVERKAIVTLGIPPTRPETGYGYIEVDPTARVDTSSGHGGFKVRAFREKPSPETAREYMASGDFLWNSGMFFFTIETLLREIGHAQPDALTCIQRVAEELKTGDHSAATKAFEKLPNISFDYAVMEHAQSVLVIPTTFPWDDVGAWDAMERTYDADANGNVQQGASVLIDVRNSIVVNDDPSIQVGILGLNGVIVVATKDSVLVCAKDQAQRVREIATAVQS